MDSQVLLDWYRANLIDNRWRQETLPPGDVRDCLVFLLDFNILVCLGSLFGNFQVYSFLFNSQADVPTGDLPDPMDCADQGPSLTPKQMEQKWNDSGLSTLMNLAQ